MYLVALADSHMFWLPQVHLGNLHKLNKLIVVASSEMGFSARMGKDLVLDWEHTFIIAIC